MSAPTGYVVSLILADEALAQAQRELPGSHPDRPDLLSLRTRLGLVIKRADRDAYYSSEEDGA